MGNSPHAGGDFGGGCGVGCVRDYVMKYYVLSRGENPVQLFFDEQTAMKAGEETFDAYLDIFDEQGNKLETLKHVTDGDACWWTDGF